MGMRLLKPNESISLSLSTGTALSGGLVSYLTQSITATIQDDDSAGVRLIITDGITLSEASLSDSYTITLNSVPTAAVTVYITPDIQLDLGLGSGVGHQS